MVWSRCAVNESASGGQHEDGINEERAKILDNENRHIANLRAKILKRDDSCTFCKQCIISKKIKQFSVIL